MVSKKESKKKWIIDGILYDLTGYVEKHPGGKGIFLGEGLADSTALFHMHHGPITAAHKAILLKYKIGTVTKEECFAANQEKVIPKGVHDSSTVGNYTYKKDGFYSEIKRKVERHFRNTKFKGKWRGKAPYRWQLFAGVIPLLLTISYFNLFFFSSRWTLLGLCIIGPILGALRALHVHTLHCANHLGLFPNNSLNLIFARLTHWTAHLSVWEWNNDHLYSHHVFPQTQRDLQNNYPLKRTQECQKFFWMHKYQYIYMWFIYSFSIPLWIVSDILNLFGRTFLQGENDMMVRYDGKRINLLKEFENLATYTGSLCISVIFPFLCFPPLEAIVLILGMNVVNGIIITASTAPNHELKGCLRSDDTKEMDFGLHQVLTSNNFACDSFMTLLFSGGLNFQVEHHLFPNVHWSHYPDIQKIVKATCKEKLIPYFEDPTWWAALVSHYECLVHFSKESAKNPFNPQSLKVAPQ